MALTPRAYPLIGYPKAWTPGTNGQVTGEAVLAVISTERDFDTFRGKLRGKFVLGTAMRDVPAHFDAPGHRYTEAELVELSKQPDAGGGRGGRGNFQANQEFAKKKTQFWVDEGVAAVLDISRGDGGTLFVQGGGSRDPKDPPSPAQVVIAVEQYGRIVRTLEKKIPVTLSMKIDNRFDDTDLNAFNIVGELPGSDKADEVVMIGAHFDSWHTGTGATDNAAGSAVMMEAMRLLKVSGVKLRRTVRIGLWGGEEQGLLGSKEYIKAHYADPVTMVLKPEHAKFAGYFNVDNGTGLIRGVYLQGNEAVAPIFQQWMEPFKNLGMNTLTIRNTGGTDHLSYDAVGLPGFQFIQDDTRRTETRSCRASRCRSRSRRPAAARRRSRKKKEPQSAEGSPRKFFSAIAACFAVPSYRREYLSPHARSFSFRSRASACSSIVSTGHGNRYVQFLSLTVAGSLTRSGHPKAS